MQLCWIWSVFALTLISSYGTLFCAVIRKDSIYVFSFLRDMSSSPYVQSQQFDTWSIHTVIFFFTFFSSFLFAFLLPLLLLVVMIFSSFFFYVVLESLYWCIYAIFNTAESSFFSWHIESVYVFFGMLDQKHYHQFSVLHQFVLVPPVSILRIVPSTGGGRGCADVY